MGENVGGAITSAIHTTKEKKSHKLVPLDQKAAACYQTGSNGTSASCDNEKVFISPGGVWRHGWDETIGTGALEFGLAVIKGGD